MQHAEDFSKLIKPHYDSEIVFRDVLKVSSIAMKGRK